MREWTDENNEEILESMRQKDGTLKLPSYNTELAYALEDFECDNDRPPNEEEAKAIQAEVRDKVDAMQEAYAEYKASGAFQCAVCSRTHYHNAPKPCRDAYNSDRF